MRRFGIALPVALCAVLLAQANYAQQASTFTIPNLIRYGGTLKNAEGAVVSSSTVGVSFAIYQQQEGGAPLWMETQNVTTDAGGNYSVLLGSTTVAGLPGDLFSQQEQRWLGVQVQGETEQPRVLLVSVPYAFKAHEAETLGGKSAADFMPANSPNSLASAVISGQAASAGQGVSSSGNVQPGETTPGNLPPQNGPTTFAGSNATQIVGVTQSGSGDGIVASTFNSATSSSAVLGTINGPGVAVFGQAYSTSGQAYGVEGTSSSTIGVGLLGFATATTGSTYGLKGYTSSTSGTGVRGLSTAVTGYTTGISASVSSPSGTAGVFNNVAGGNILIGQNNGTTKFTVDGSGDVNIAGNFTGSGTGITGITFSQLTGHLASSQFSGTYSDAVTLSNTSNVFSGSSFNVTGSGTALEGLGGYDSSTTGSAVGGSASATTGSANGVYGLAASGGGIGVFGQNMGTSGSAIGVYGRSVNGTGVYGTGPNSGVQGQSTGQGVYGVTASSSGIGVYGLNEASSGTAWGVAGFSNSTSTSANGVYGKASSGTGVYGTSSSGNGVGVQGANLSTSGYAYGVAGYTSSTQTNSAGVYGQSGAGYGVYGNSTSAPGVYGQSSTGAGVSGQGTYGVVGAGVASVGAGVYGQAINVNGVEGVSTSVAGVKGQSTSGNGVDGVSSSAAGLHGESTSGPGVYGTTSSTTNAGVYAINTNTSNNAGPGLYAQNSSNDPSSAAGYFVSTGTPGYILKGVNGVNNVVFSVDTAGDLTVAGTLTKGGGSFKIDDPLDPANKMLSHSFVESPDMMNIYNGIVRLDARGEAWVELPQYFEALNRDFRYQLTSIGAPQPRLYIAREVKGNRFKIAGGKAGAKVSWQVTGVRQDAWANAHRIPNEEDKPLDKRGTYLHPELYGAAADKNTNAMLQH